MPTRPARPVDRAAILHVGPHAARGPKGLVRLSPTQYALLAALVRLPPDHVARYDDITRALWPDRYEPHDARNAIHWHAGTLNKLLELAGYAPRAIKVVDRVGLRFDPRAQD